VPQSRCCGGRFHVRFQPLFPPQSGHNRSGSFGAVNIGQEYILHATKSGSSFVFTASGQTQTFPVPGSPTAPPRGPFGELLTRIDPTTPANGGQWAVVATFDNVMVDQ